MARNANCDDIEAMARLPEHPGQNSVGPRSLAFSHPEHSLTRLQPYFQVFRDGIFLSEEANHLISFACAIRISAKWIGTAHTWLEATGEGAEIAHIPNGQWLYVARLAYTAGPGHAHLSSELEPLLASLKNLAVNSGLSGVAFPAKFPGFRDLAGTTDFQRSCIKERNDQVRSGLHPIGVAHHIGFRHEIALPNYFGDGRHFALMVWRPEET